MTTHTKQLLKQIIAFAVFYAATCWAVWELVK